jgi:hypothetical protein
MKSQRSPILSSLAVFALCAHAVVQPANAQVAAESPAPAVDGVDASPGEPPPPAAPEGTEESMQTEEPVATEEPSAVKASADSSASERPAVAPSAPAEQAYPTPSDGVTSGGDVAPRKIAVLDLRTSQQDAPLGNALAAVLTSELGRRPGIRAISRNEVRALVEQQAATALLGCESEKCAADLGSVLEADAIISGAVDFVDGAHLVSLALIDSAGKLPTERLEWTWRGSSAELVTMATPAVYMLLRGDSGDKATGSLRIDAPDGAEVQLDGAALGVAPLEDAVEGLPIGVHDIVVTKDGHVERHTSAVVSPEETSLARVTLEALPFYSQGWFWGTVAATAGGVVLTAASVTAFVLASTLPLPAKAIDVRAGLPTATAGLAGVEGGQR